MTTALAHADFFPHTPASATHLESLAVCIRVADSCVVVRFREASRAVKPQETEYSASRQPVFKTGTFGHSVTPPR